MHSTSLLCLGKLRTPNLLFPAVCYMLHGKRAFYSTLSVAYNLSIGHAKHTRLQQQRMKKLNGLRGQRNESQLITSR